MDTNEQIESLDEGINPSVPEQGINNAPAQESIEQPVNNTVAPAPKTIGTPVTDAPVEPNSLGVSAPEPINLNDMVAPTNPDSTNIDSFNQDGISLGVSDSPKPSSLETVIKSEEYNDIGKVPPNAHIEEKPKKKKNKTLLLLFVIILIAGVGFGVYYYLGLGNKVKLTLKNVKINIGDTISTNVKDYVSIGTPDSSCVTNFDEVDVNKVGNYQYKIICNSGTFIGKIDVVDESAPAIYLKTPIVNVNNTVAIEDFVLKCSREDCTYSFVDEEGLKTNLATAGNYEVKINVSAGENNSKVVTAYLVVVDNLINRQLECTSAAIKVEADNYSYTIKDQVPIAIINSELAYAGFTIREYTLTYDTPEAYKAAVATIKEDNTMETSIVKGIANYIDSDKQIIITEIKTKEDMVSEFTDYPDNYSELRNKYENSDKSYECVLNF